MEKNNGQVIFVEPRWITGETCLFAIKDPFEYMYARNKVTKLRTEFLERLKREGFVITCDKENVPEGAIYFIMDDTAICDYSSSHTIGFYKKAFDQRIIEAGGEKLNYPYSLSMEEYFQNPFFPAVFKNESTNGGIDKFLIETPEQLEVIKKFYHDFSNNKLYQAAFGCSIFQQLIETPTTGKSYMRVLMSASGDVMGASLKYSKGGTYRKEAEGLFEQHFWNPNSPYYLNCSGMFNYYSEGENISFSQPRFSTEKAKILMEHGIEPTHPEVPNEVLEVASAIATKCNRELGIISGMDFILNKHDGKWYYLEIQAFPAIEEWAVTKGIRKLKKGDINDYINYLKISLEARYASLMMCMEKKTYGAMEDAKTHHLTLKKNQ